MSVVLVTETTTLSDRSDNFHDKHALDTAYYRNKYIM